MKQKDIKNNGNTIFEAYSRDNVAILLGCSDEYVPYLYVCLKSIIETSSHEHNYDILISENSISENNKEKLLNITDRENFSLRFLNIKSDFSQLNLSMPDHVSCETYFKLMAPEYLRTYKKCLFLDADIIVKEDLYNLYQTDVSDYPLAAVSSCMYAGLINLCPDVLQYTKEELKLVDPYKYFQGGVLLINIEEFNKNNYGEKLLELASSNEYKFADQCLLNSFFKDNIKYLDNTWNFETCQNCFSEISTYMPLKIKEKYNEARKAPKIIHYAGHEKPWVFPEEEMAEIWWSYARQTLFYEILLKRMTASACPPANFAVLEDVLNYKKNIFTYWRYKILAKIKCGEKKQHYKIKRDQLKQKIRNAKAILKK